MGDSGALLLGFVLAAISVEGLLKTAAAVALAFPLLVLAIPILDTSFVVAKRIKHGKPIYSADRFHLHHRFLERGFTQRRAVADDVRVVRDAGGRGARDPLSSPRTRTVAGSSGRPSPTRVDRARRDLAARPTSSTCSRSSR